MDSVLEHGLWRSPYMKIYSLGYNERVMELSTYPRAYKDTELHLYKEDTPFIVQEADLNYSDRTNRFYHDVRNNLFKLGQEAIHFEGDPLPGAFPLWIESETLPEPIYGKKLHIFPILKEVLVGQLASIIVKEARYFKDRTWASISPTINKDFLSQIPTDKLTMAKNAKEPDRQIIYLKYQRIIRLK